MSFDVYLMDSTGSAAAVAPHEEGGTYQLGGCHHAELNITYNYSQYYYAHLDKDQGLRWLNGRRAKDCIEALEAAVEKLSTERDANYWNGSPGNAGAALAILLRWARTYPEATFTVD